MSSGLKKIGGSKRFSAIAIHNDVVHLAGQVSQLVEGDITAQSKDVFTKVDNLLAEAGTTRENVFSVQIWLADMREYDEMNNVWDEWVADLNAAPTRVCVEARMAKPHYKIEVLVLAAQ
ncbi:endoribonuclease L-PSP [Pseudovibrio sp. FO-BEG1]|uniref:RidA family protein n=1 Tax=Pseudovibrio sp. (strain FO-BEG1) TaxID=911045 RepID=UPI000238CE38|nr:RidA family protein [Pseudovibrio sp. FO-BEG1]AEV35690.1 endoribonuclease L-PSP [Pseudovibrio sp. FO-BEG1]